MSPPLDVIVIGGGQAGPAVSYYLRRADIRFLVLDNATLGAHGSTPGRAFSERLLERSLSLDLATLVGAFDVAHGAARHSLHIAGIAFLPLGRLLGRQRS